jgi:hypothetical protein
MYYKDISLRLKALRIKKGDVEEYITSNSEITNEEGLKEAITMAKRSLDPPYKSLRL